MKSGCIRLGTIAGIPLELHFSWAIVFALLAWSLATGYFPKVVPDLPAGSYWSKGILAALLLLASILAHELAQVKAVPPEERDQVSVQAVALPVEAPVRTAPGADAVDALQQMLQAGHGRLLVFERETFRGLLTHTGVTRLLQIKMALRM